MSQSIALAATDQREPAVRASLTFIVPQDTKPRFLSSASTGGVVDRQGEVHDWPARSGRVQRRTEDVGEVARPANRGVVHDRHGIVIDKRGGERPPVESRGDHRQQDDRASVQVIS